MKKYFITGLVILLPLAITILVINFLINFLTKPFVGAFSSFVCSVPFFEKGFLFLSREQLILYGSKILILFTLVAGTIGLGMIARWFFMKSFINICDKILHRIPIVNTVYKTTQEIVKTVFTSKKDAFQKVVMVPFPRSDVYVIGLIARESPEACCKITNQQLVSVFVPTTPNPTTGFLLMFKKEDLVYVDIKPEDAVKYIVSCGVIIPESLNTKTPLKENQESL